jgi:hypothetical protein
MLRISVALLVLFLVATVTGTAVTGLYWVSVAATAGVLVSGAVVVSLLRMPDDEEAAGGGAVARPMTPSRRASHRDAPPSPTGRRGRAA